MVIPNLTDKIKNDIGFFFNGSFLQKKLRHCLIPIFQGNDRVRMEKFDEATFYIFYYFIV